MDHPALNYTEESAIVQLSVAGLDLYGSADTTGNNDSILDDLQRLGATVGRQLGGADFWWDALTDRAAPIPALDEVYHQIVTSANVAKQAEFLKLAYEKGVKPHYMFLGAGGGHRGTDTFFDHRQVVDAVSILWDVPLLTRFTDPNLLSAMILYPELANVLYIENAYDQQVIGMMAYSCAALLVEAWAQAIEDEPGVFDGKHISEIVHAVEFCNELQTVYQILDGDGNPDAEVSGQAWAPMLYLFSVAFHQVFALSGEDCPALWMPGILSYGDAVAEGSAASSRTYGQDWFRALCREISRLNTDSPSGFETDSLFSGTDYHWYHFHGIEAHPAEPRPTWLLPAEVLAIETTLHGAGFPSARVSMFESGMRGNNDLLVFGVNSAGQPAPADFLPANYSVDEEGESRFQAHEVWRRILGACAAGAAPQGWFTMIAAYLGNDGTAQGYHDFGLRVDSQADGSGGMTDISEVRFSTQRPAWYAFQRLAWLLARGGGLRHLRRISVTGTDEELGSFVDAPEDVDRREDALIFELNYQDREDSYPFAYVVMLDPWRNTSGLYVAWTAGSASASIVRADFEPSEWTDTVTPDFRLPRSDATWDEPRGGVASSHRLVLGHDPLIYLSSERLAWAVDDEADDGLSSGSHL